MNTLPACVQAGGTFIIEDEGCISLDGKEYQVEEKEYKMATIKDVARESGLTVGTVSRVLNNRGYISDKTRNRVYEVMAELNYQPNEVARSLIKQKTNTIGVIVPHIVHPYFAKMISAVEKAVSEKNYKILLYNSRGSQKMEKRYLEMCESNRVSGVLLFSYEVNPEELLKLHIPIVMMERYLDNGTASVVCDNHYGGMLAAEHLIQKGCRNLIMFGGVETNSMPADHRENGFYEVCKREGISGEVFKSHLNEYAEMEYHKYIERVLRERPNTDGIFASSDLIAAQVIQTCKILCLDIPSQIKLVGFDDVSLASLTTPGITTIHQHIDEMAELAVDFLLKASRGETIPQKTVLPVKLVERGTT